MLFIFSKIAIIKRKLLTKNKQVCIWVCFALCLCFSRVIIVVSNDVHKFKIRKIWIKKKDDNLCKNRGFFFFTTFRKKLPSSNFLFIFSKLRFEIEKLILWWAFSTHLLVVQSIRCKNKKLFLFFFFLIKNIYYSNTGSWNISNTKKYLIKHA